MSCTNLSEICSDSPNHPDPQQIIFPIANNMGFENEDNREVDMNCSEIGDLPFVNIDIEKNSVEDWFNNSENIHPHMDCKKSEAMAMIMLYYLKHNLSWAALTDLLKLINSIFGADILPQSKYLFKKLFPLEIIPVHHFFCQNCSLYIETFESNQCKNCLNEVNFDTGKGNNFFITLPIEPQIKQILEKNSNNLKFFENDLQLCDNIRDIYDGKGYRKLIQDNNNFLSLTLNTDGVSIFKSKRKSSFWPLQFIINELDRSVRFKPDNIIVSGFWFGTDPIMEIFFKPLIKEIEGIHQNPIKVKINDQNRNFEIYPLLCTVDTVAKDKIQKKKQFNGYFGCSYCVHPGTLVNRKQIRYSSLNGDFEKRTHDSAVSDMIRASMTDTVSNGFKNVSPLIAISKFNVIDGFPIDYMHNIALGVANQLLELWFDSKHHGKEFYIGLRIKRVNERLLKIKPPEFIGRKPRSLNERNIWKAHEFRYWVLFYSIPSLLNILPLNYVIHYSLLVDCVHLYLSTEISRDELLEAATKMDKFVQEFERLYGTENMTYNIHLLKHIKDCVEYCGPLWVYSNFPFENNNGILKKYVKGTKDVLKQITSKYCYNMLLNSKSYSKFPPNVKKFNNLINPKYNIINRENKLLGKSKELVLSNQEKNTFYQNGFNIDNIRVHDRVTFKNDVLGTRDYCTKIKSDNSIVQLNSGKYLVLL